MSNDDDYYLYRGFNDTRFVLVQHDLDSIFGMGQNPGSTTANIFLAANIPTINRFIRHPEFVPRYYYHLKNLIETTFSPEQMNPFLDELLGGFVAPGTIQQMKDFVVQRNAYVLLQIPSDLTIVSDLTQVSGTLATDRILDTASGPWHVTGDIVVPSGRTLTIEAGTTLFFDGGTGITVTSGGRLVAEGTEYNRIRLTAVPGGADWDGVKFDHTLTDNRLAYLDHEFGDGQDESTDVQYSRVTIDNVTWSGTDIRVLNIDHPSVICRNSVFPSVGGSEPLHGVGLSGSEYMIFEWFFQDPLPEYGPTGEVIIDYSSLPSPWHYLGVGNIDADPLFVDEVGGDFRLKTDSGAIGTGAWGLDMGAMAPAGAAISGEPPAVTYHTNATLTVGGPGIVSYKYSLNSPTGPWSAERTVDVPVALTGLANGQSYTLYAVGKNSAGVWQSAGSPAVSHTWTIDTSHCELVINEVLAHTHGNDPSELNFKLSADGEMIGLFDADLNMIDQVLYGPQTTDVSQGRSPDGSSNCDFFDLPTPWVANTSAPIITEVTTVLAPENATKRAIVPASPDAVDETWKSDPDFDDSTWLVGTGSPGGVGFETHPTDTINYVSLITLDVEAQMDGFNETCYIRIPFTADGDDLADFTEMTLKIRYDDGFVAYINDTELTTARRNFAGTPAWDSGADGQHSDSMAILFEYIDISEYLDALRPGNNVLAIQGMNDGLGSSDFLISAELEVKATTIDYGEFPYPDAPDQLAGLRITELMYHDPSGSNFDYIELQNISDAAIKLDGLRFLDGILFEFPAGQLNPNECIVVVGDLTSFRSRYGYSARVAGEYAGALSGGGEKIVLSLAWPLEAAIMRFEYSDAWYPTTDGGGDSLTINDGTAHPYLWNDAESWHAAAPSPGLP